MKGGGRAEGGRRLKLLRKGSALREGRHGVLRGSAKGRSECRLGFGGMGKVRSGQDSRSGEAQMAKGLRRKV